MTQKTVFFTLLFCLAAHSRGDDLLSWWESHSGTAAQIERKQPANRSGKRYTGIVTAVSDGDTLRITDTHGQKHKIRLAYIDAPELQQAHGQTARKALETVVLGQTVEVHIFDTDRYRREVAQIWSNRRDVNLMQVMQGHAWHYVSIAKRRQHKQDYAAYTEAERAARRERLGLWQNHNAQAPWVFRQQERKQTDTYFLR